jgi:hypothetical protein
MAVIIWVSLRNDAMIAPSLNLGISCPKNADRQPQEVPRLVAMLVVILALVNVSATVLMVESWASMNTGMHELERSLQDYLIDIAD